jgi:hypothetical protein
LNHRHQRLNSVNLHHHHPHHLPNTVNNVKVTGIPEIAGMVAATGIATTVDHADHVPIKVSVTTKGKGSAPIKAKVKAHALNHPHVPIKPIRVNRVRTKHRLKKAIAAAAGKNGAIVSKSGRTVVVALIAVMPQERKVPQPRVVIPKVPTHRRP